MEVKTFDSGIHLKNYYKELTKDKKIEKCKLPSKVIIPFSQHTGLQCKPIVNVGDIVKRGQKIAEADGFITAPIHASLSGKVTEIAPYLTSSGKKVLSCVIESDGLDSLDPGIKSRPGYLKLSSNEIISIVKEAGIVGQGGAMFPSHVKLSPPKEKNLDTLIINGAECEPYLSCDHRLMLECAQEIISGIEIIMHASGIKKAFIGIEINKQDAIEVLKLAGKNTLGLEIIPLQIKYPQGSEKHIIKAITGREIPSGGLPQDVGVLINNVGTIFAVYKAVIKGEPLIERVVTVSGSEIDSPKNLLVRIGTPLEDIISYCGGIKNKNVKIIMGGAMMGTAQVSVNVPIIKGTSGILVIPEQKVTTVTECIRCSRCVDVCPMKLSPYALVDRAEFNYYGDIEKYHLMDCNECGCCSYICPAKRHMVQYIRQAKIVVKNKNITNK